MKVISLRHPRDKAQLLEQFDAHTTTWVVPDVETKLSLQETLLRRHPFLPGDSVLRASELWQKLLLRVRPDLQVVSPDFARNWIADLLDKSPHQWASTPGAAPLLYEYITQLMPILTHPEGAAQLLEWFEQKPESASRWRHWFELAQFTWGEFLQRGLVASQWVSGVLVNELDFERAWEHALIFDLGVGLIHVESDLIQQIARTNSVTVLEPHPEWHERFSKTLLPYQNLRPPSKEPPPSVSFQPKVNCCKFTTMLAEVKFATAQIRQWADAGVPLPHIAVVMPDMEIYWPVLSAYLNEEGLPVQKSQTTSLHSLPTVARWLAQLRLRSDKVTSADLELCTFTSESRSAIGFDRFKRLFTQIYGNSDLQRDETLRRIFAATLNSDALLDRDQFVAWSLQYWDADGEAQDLMWLERLQRQLFQECSPDLQMKLCRWIRLVEQIATRCEITLMDSRSDGVNIVNLASSDGLASTHMILLGLTEAALRKHSRTAILYGDVLSISSQVGFHLAYPDQSHLEFAARWLLEDDSRRFYLCCATSDFSGVAMAPALLWLEHAIDEHVHERTLTPPLTRWDEMQKASLDQLATVRDWNETQQLKLVAGIEQDLGLTPRPNFAANQTWRLSASSLENYLRCPFVFAAERLLKLADVSALDLDIDPRTRGQLMHSVFEALLRESREWTEADLVNLVEACRAQVDLEFADERLWPPLRQKYVTLAKRFLEVEHRWQVQFPQIQTVGVELAIDGYMSQTGHLTREPGEGHHVFRGKIDRLDSDGEGHFIVLDYKSSRSEQTTPATKWVENQSLQLALYSMAVEAGVVRGDSEFLPPGEVAGAFYYIAKGMNRDIGLRLGEYEGVLYPVQARAKKINQVEKQNLFAEISQRIGAQLDVMREGRFAPQPRSESECVKCRWRSLCRAPHLN